MKIAMVTSLVPDKLNRNGPSGLIWEVKKTLHYYGHQVDVINAVQRYKNVICNQLYIMGYLDYDLSQDIGDYDRILVYPDVVMLSIPVMFLRKTIVLAPDATSMARIRKYIAYKQGRCNIKNILCIFYQSIFYHRFHYLERKYIPRVKYYLVVGKSDRRWLQHLLPLIARKKVLFLRHPLLLESLTTLNFDHILSSQKKRFVFSGDMSFSYVGNNIQLLADELEILLDTKDKIISILVVGKKNRWISDIFSNRTNFRVDYIDWIDSYQDICRIGVDIHCVPLLTGAGTKNRVVTAIANALDIISTPIGTENILLENISGVYICHSMKEFANKMFELLEIGDSHINEIYMRMIERRKFRIRTTKEYESTLLKALE